MVELTANLLGEIKCTKAAFASGKPKWPAQDQEGVKRSWVLWAAKTRLLLVLNSPQMHPGCTEHRWGLPTTMSCLALSRGYVKAFSPQPPSSSLWPSCVSSQILTDAMMWEKRMAKSAQLTGNVFVPPLAVSLARFLTGIWADLPGAPPGCPVPGFPQGFPPLAG